MSLGVDGDPEVGMGSVQASAPPPGSTQNPDGSWTDPNGNNWTCNNGVCLEHIGGTSTSAPAPVIFIYGLPVGMTLGGGGTGLAILPATPGQTCVYGAGIPSTGLGADIPPPAGDTADTDIINIYALYEPATGSVNPAAPGGWVFGNAEAIVGYLYVTVSGQYFFQSNGVDPNLITNILASLPGGSALNAASNGAYVGPLSSTQVNTFFKLYPIRGNQSTSGKGSLPCFTTPLPKSQWT